MPIFLADIGIVLQTVCAIAFHLESSIFVLPSDHSASLSNRCSHLNNLLSFDAGTIVTAGEIRESLGLTEVNGKTVTLLRR